MLNLNPLPMFSSVQKYKGNSKNIKEIGPFSIFLFKILKWTFDNFWQLWRLYCRGPNSTFDTYIGIYFFWTYISYVIVIIWHIWQLCHLWHIINDIWQKNIWQQTCTCEYCFPKFTVKTLADLIPHLKTKLNILNILKTHYTMCVCVGPGVGGCTE